MNYKLAVIPGDGIGPDVVEQTLLVLDKVGEKFGHTFQYHKVLAGGCAIDATGGCLPQETIDMCKASDAVLLLSLIHISSSPKWARFQWSRGAE